MTDHIVIGDIRPRIQYTADGVQTDFTYPFPIFAAGDLKVYLGDALQAGGYTVSGAGQSAGGLASFATAPAAGTKVTLLRALAVARNSDFQEGGAFRAKTINDELDRQTAFVQEVGERIERALVAGPTESAAPLVLPPPAARANALLGFDAAGAPLAVSGSAGGVTVSAAMTPLVQAADAAAARAALGLGSAALADTGPGNGELPFGNATRLSRLAEAIKTVDYAVVAADAGAMLIANKATAIAFTLPTAAALGLGFAFMTRNIGAGDLTLDPNAAETINGAATLVLKQNEAAMVWTDGTLWRANVWGVGSTGKLVQRAFATYTAWTSSTAVIPNDDSIPQDTEGTQTVSQNFTPIDANNRIRVTMSVNATAGINTYAGAALFRSGQSAAKAATRFNIQTGQAGSFAALIHEEAAGDTSTRLWQCRCGPIEASSTIYFNGNAAGRIFGGTLAHTMVIEEIAP